MATQNPLLPDPQAPESSFPPVPSAGVTGAEVKRIGQFLDHSVSDNTRSMYRSAWKSFEKWAQDRAALAAIHKTNGNEDPTDNEGVRQMLKGIARSHGKAQMQAKPLTSEALAVVRATATGCRALGGGKKQESAERASWRGRVDLALLSVLRDGLLRRSEAAGLTWNDIELRDNGTVLINVRRSKTDPDAEGVTLFIGHHASQALRAIMPAEELLDPTTRVFALSPQQIGRRIKAAAVSAGLGEGFTGHSGRVGMAQDLAKAGAELPALMTAGRWKSSTMPARYTERQAADRGAVARYYQQQGN